MDSRKLNWPMALFFISTPIVAVLGTIWYVLYGQMLTATWVLMTILVIFSGVSITAGYHRLFSHRAYQASLPVRLFFVVFGAASLEGSVLEWATDHRNHHLYTDQDRDPYNAKRGLWYSHLGWILRLDPFQRDFSNVSDLAKDPLLAWQHKWFLPLGAFMTFVFPVLIAAVWGDPMGGLLIAGLLRMVINHHTTFFINSFAHYFGKQVYSDRTTARDNWLLSLVTYGEGFHNFHHQFALDYRNGVRWYHFDITKWLIFILSKLGLASNLRRVSPKIIIQHRMEMAEKGLASTKSYSSSYLAELLDPIRTRLSEALEAFEKCHEEYQQHKLERVHQHIEASRARLKQAQQNLKANLKSWDRLVRRMMKQASTV